MNKNHTRCTCDTDVHHGCVKIDPTVVFVLVCAEVHLVIRLRGAGWLSHRDGRVQTTLDFQSRNKRSDNDGVYGNEQHE